MERPDSKDSGVLGAEAGSTSDHVSAFWDLLPTVAEITGAEAPTNSDGNSFLATLKGNSAYQTPDKPLYWEYHAFGGMQAVRMGDWKGVRLEIRRQDNAPVQLFNLTSDPNEENDVASANPDIVALIRAVMDARIPSVREDWNFVRDSNP